MHILLKTLLVATFALKTMAADTDSSGTAQSLNLFSSSLFHAIAEGHRGNLVTSPASAGITLAMAACGAQGQTLDQFKKILHKIDMSGYQTIIDDLNNLRENKLLLANKMFTAEHFTVNPVYKDLTETYFRSVAQAIDFATPQIAASTINAWVKQNTNKLISDIIIPENLDKKTKLVLVDAVYFKGQWKDNFNPKSTQIMPFNIDSNTVKNVPTMLRQGIYRYGEHNDLYAKFIVMPYKASELSIVIILPNETDGLARVEKKLQNMNLADILYQGDEIQLKIYLPKFRVEKLLDLSPALQKLGLTEAFTERANFSGIASEHLHISKVLQKTVIEFDEDGTEASAAGETGQTARLVPTGRNLPASPMELTVNHPFIYSIVKTGNFNLELLRGQIIDPGSE